MHMPPASWSPGAISSRAIATVNGELWFDVMSVCEELSLEAEDFPSTMSNSDFTLITLPDRPERTRNVPAVSEAGVYRLLMASQTLEAREWREWAIPLLPAALVALRTAVQARPTFEPPAAVSTPSEAA